MNAASHHFSDVSASGRVSGLHVTTVPVAASNIFGAADAMPPNRPVKPAAVKAAPPARPYLTNSRRLNSRENGSSPLSGMSVSPPPPGNVTGDDRGEDIAPHTRKSSRR